ncbi:MAG: Methyl-accepting chemotaxis protein PctC [Pelotomaculum sp. PtaB.Bin104]|nr:MAG: Methyl-accepting chemotaxis protein PctC [Pelotomaculum sp. PtaB.Bin104]
MLKSIKSKILALLLLAVAVLIVTNLIAVVAARQSQAKQLNIALYDSAMANSKMIDERIRRHIDRLSVLANTATVQGDDIASTKSYLLFEHKRNLDQEGYYFDLIAAIEPDGSSFDINGDKVEVYDRVYFQEVLAGKDLVISEPIFSRSGGKISVAIATAVKKDGKLVRVLMGMMSLEKLSDEIITMKHGENGRAYMIDDRGTCLAHQDKTLLGLDFTRENGPITAEMANMVQLMLATKTGAAEYSFRGVNSILNYQQIPSTGWFLGIVADRSEVFAEINRLTSLLAVIIFITTLLLLVLGWRFTGKTVQPISELVDATRRIAQGDLETKIAVHTDDEIGHLAQSFERMRLDTKDLISNIALAGNRVSDIARVLAIKADQTAETVKTKVIPADTASSAAGKETKELTGIADERLSEMDRGQQGIDNVVSTMREIEKSANQVTLSISTLNQAIDDVGAFVDAINAIAGQTDKLAEEAAIEATRAGEAGKGFAVVADEVRKLAESSSESAAEISRLISRVVSEVQQQSAASLEDGKKKMPRNERVMQHINQSLVAITGLVQDLSEKAKEVAEAAEEVGIADQDADKDIISRPG